MAFKLKASTLAKVCKGKSVIMEGVAKHFNTHAPRYGLTTELRVAHFLAQAAHECDQFRTLREYWGPTAAQKKYEGRTDLGNVKAGDGKRYMGRGIFQLTGRANYAEMSKTLNVDIEADPDKAEDPEISLLIALEYWRKNNLNKWADADDIRRISKRINGGYNGFEDRKAYYAKFKPLIDAAFREPEPKPITPPPPEPVHTEPEPHPEDCQDCQVDDQPKDDTPPQVSYEQAVQQRLNLKLGIQLVVDGIHGPRTKNAIREFQKKQGIPNTGILDTQTILELFSN